MTTKRLLTQGMPAWALASSTRLVAGVLLALTLLTTHLQAFSLMGPYADWMTPALGYRLPDDVGGPMDINEEYRWNVPIVTYAFDPSFVNYFGSNGVAAVEQAFEILNNLPPASSLDLTNYPMDSRRINWRASTQHLYDLKSATLPLLLEQMGLAEPVRNIYTLRRWDPLMFSADPYPGWDIDRWCWFGFVIQRNFDPETLLPNPYLDGILYLGYIFYVEPFNPDPAIAQVLTCTADPALNYGAPSSVADWKAGYLSWRLSTQDLPDPGLLFTNLSQEDVGGLRYLLSTNNLNWEILLPDVHGTGTNAAAFVNLALRPGVEKIIFRRQDYDALLGQAVPFIYQFTDTYITNGMLMHQQLERVVTQPDFLFSAADTGQGKISTPIYMRSGTTNWWNSAKTRGQTNNGPGVIRPPVRITFHKRHPITQSYETTLGTMAQVYDYKWGSFDEFPTNPPVVYPSSASEDNDTLILRFRLLPATFESTQTAHYTWELPVKTGEQATLQVSTNLIDWVSCAVVTNVGALIEWQHSYSSLPQKFFRVIPH